jgi:uncharacterized protein (TIGR02598 family)
VTDHLRRIEERKNVTGTLRTDCLANEWGVSQGSRLYALNLNNHQKDNPSHSDIIGLYKVGRRSTVCPLKSVVLSGTTPQVDSETERSCRQTRCFLIRAPARGFEPASRGHVVRAERLFRPGRSTAFTLIEVVIAVGLVAFVLTAILGLVAIAVNETKNADLKARLTWITEQVTSEFQSQRFSTALASVPTNNYWDYSGTRTNLSGAYFVCGVSNVTPTTNFSTNMALLQVSIRWPNPQLTSTNVSLISIFNYQ